MVDARRLDPVFTPSSRLSAVRFLTYSGEEIKKISCKKITNPNTFDSLLHPNVGGLYDPALGPCGKDDACGTCGLNYVHCPGHMGHIPLPLPVYHPIFFMTLYQVLRSSCWNCHRWLCSAYKAHLLRGQLELLSCGLVSDAVDLETVVTSADSNGDSGRNEGAEGASVGSVIQSIAQCVENCTASMSGNKPPKTKILVELKRQLVADFLKACSAGGASSKCPHCSAPIRAVKQERHIRIFLKGLSKKLASAWVTARNKEVSRRKEAQLQQCSEVETEESEGNNSDSAIQTALELSGIQTRLVGDSGTELVTVEDCLKQKYVSPLEAREHVRELWVREKMLMSAMFGCGLELAEGVGGLEDLFFLDVVPVPPSRFRPVAQLGEKRFENPQTANLHQVLVDCLTIHELMVEREREGEEEGAGRRRRKSTREKLSFSERLQVAWVKLQLDVNCFMDSSSDKRGTVPSGIKQILEKKEGLFRKNMMGKRVDFAARSVISPDPYINMDEIGVPLVFATRLTYPQPVTHWNVRELRQAVTNGPNIHPGATHVQNEDGSVVLLSAHNPRQRSAIAKKLLTPSKGSLFGGASKKVFRHLKDGDVLLLNRQPTLHKPSIMAHRARVLPGEKTLRLHYANCKSYNADFDGDEMNAHFPQNEVARAEAYNIVSTHYQYLVPKDGTPLSGLIQDHVVSGLLLTIRGRTFTRADYMQLVFNALPRFHGYFTTLPPSIMKPQQLWSGKQVLSTVLLNIIPDGQEKLNLTSRAKIAPKEWGRGAVRDGVMSEGRGSSKKKHKKKKKKRKGSKYTDDIMTESEVVFRQGELLCGVLDKSQFGASQFGFVHCCYELYGGAVSNLLLSALGRLFTTFLQLHSFTLGVEDILVTPEADVERRKVMAEAKDCGLEAAAEAFGITDPQDTAQLQRKYETAHRSHDNTGLKTLDYLMKKKTDHYNNLISSACVPAGLHKPFPSNCLQLMVQSGAKGSTVNCMQISCLLGQIELEGQRPPLMSSGSFLPSFLPYDTSPRAGGFVDGRFLTGIRPQEYFYHCMAGREGLVDTAVKTSRSGYLQRCLIKHLEGICVNYDLTVRDSDGSVVQFLYGEDGMDVGKTRLLTEKQFPFLINNYQAVLYRLDPKLADTQLEAKKAVKYQRKVDRWSRRHGLPGQQAKLHKTGFLDFYEKHLPEMIDRFPHGKRSPKHNNRTKAQLQLIDTWYGISPMSRESLSKKFSQCPDPVNAHLRPDCHFGSIPEKLSQQVSSFVAKNPRDILATEEEESLKLAPEKFQNLVQLKCLRALADPGEAVGLLAAQSIGEPSTQMTLNTFHFAGRGEMNVTLGIPRLREILMTASANIKTPAMDVPLLPHPRAREEGEKLKKLFTSVCLSQVLEKVEVWESLCREGKGHRYRLYRIKMTFLPHQYYSEEFVVTASQVLGYVEKTFVKKLVSAINKEIKTIRERRLKSIVVEREGQLGQGGREEEEGEERDEQSAAPPEEDEDNEDLSDMEEGDANASAAKQMSRRQQHTSYDAPDESDEEIMRAQRESEDEASDDESGHMSGRGSADRAESEDDEMESLSSSERSIPSPTEAAAAMNLERVREVISSSGAVLDYCYDTTEELWCQLTLKFPSIDSKVMVTSVIEKLAPKSVVWEIPNIRKGYLVESTEPGEEGALRLKTDGVNLQVLWQYADILDLRKTYTNNIHAMANTYGIEAAGKAIIKEISSVFKVYGIAVDYRHLALIADYMTFEGSYKAFNRIGMETNSSPFQKMSFETTMHFLKGATVAGDTDILKSPSACLVAGRVVHGGTGCFELLQSLC